MFIAGISSSSSILFMEISIGWNEGGAGLSWTMVSNVFGIDDMDGDSDDLDLVETPLNSCVADTGIPD